MTLTSPTIHLTSLDTMTVLIRILPRTSITRMLIATIIQSIIATKTMLKTSKKARRIVYRMICIHASHKRK